ncbi:phosphate ABC transporter [Paenibacillus pini JCM 16418]|uniref:Phosphate-binding protein n=1 Tax=Paenibacillus pini JCM 16418 TaxID=1236976 RepID=W7YVL4_9BACL|nr:phosphate ABC transporter [Paenibacillus pini JCM 16418]
MKFKKPLLMFCTLALVAMLAACGNKDEGSQGSTSGTNNDTAALSGSVLAVGSTALQPLVEQVAQKFMADPKYSKIQVQVQGGGSGTGLTQVAGGQAAIGNSDVFAEEKLKDADADKAKDLIDHQVAVVGIAAVTNPDVGVDSLTKQQLIDIFSGKVKNWKEVGGKDQAIVIVNRPASSGTRKTFEKYALGTSTEDIKGSIQEESSGTVKKIVAENPGAIGYLALSYLDDKVKTVKYDGVEATVDNVKSGDYPVWHMSICTRRASLNQKLKHSLITWLPMKYKKVT